MSSYPISGCGLSSKPRAAQPSMFQILSWATNNDLAQSTFVQPQPKSIPHPHQQNLVPKLNIPSQLVSNPKPLILHEEVYKQHQSPSKPNLIQNQLNSIPEVVVDNNETKVFQKSHLFKKTIKHDLNSYQPINLKASRAKSTNVPKTEQTLNPAVQQTQLDDKTIKERQQKLKEFQVFTRILPNSAFTTYYGKPAFENYGRGTSYKNLKTFNVMPHKGDNHPKNVQSHYTALIKARNIKSKSYLPRKPLEQPLPVHQPDENQQSIQVPSLPLQKPDLIKSNRFATEYNKTGKKAGPPQTSKRIIQSAKKTANNSSNLRQQKSRSFKQPTGDGLKYLNKRENLIEILEQNKLKASQLAYKVTECYPLELSPENMEVSCVSKQNWQGLKPAGKASNKGQALKDLIESRFVLQQKNSL